MTNIPHALALNIVIIGILFIFGMYYLSISLTRRLKKINLSSLLLPVSIVLLITLFFGIGFSLLFQWA